MSELPYNRRLAARLGRPHGGLYFILQTSVKVCRTHLHLFFILVLETSNLDHPQRHDPGANGRGPKGHGCPAVQDLLLSVEWMEDLHRPLPSLRTQTPWLC